MEIVAIWWNGLGMYKQYLLFSYLITLTCMDYSEEVEELLIWLTLVDWWEGLGEAR